MKGRDRETDMKKLARMFFENLERDSCEYGGWGLDPKRPFGNSDVEDDILRGIGVEPLEEGDDYTDSQRQYAAALYDGLGEWLKEFAKKFLS